MSQSKQNWVNVNRGQICFRKTWMNMDTDKRKTPSVDNAVSKKTFKKGQY